MPANGRWDLIRCLKGHVPQIMGSPIFIKIGAEHEYVSYGCCLTVHEHKGKGKGRVGKNVSDKFLIRNGFKQGDAL